MPPRLSLGLNLGLCLALAACSSDGATGRDARPELGVAGGTLKGKVSNTAGKPVGDATIAVGSLSTVADFKGQYELTDVPAGEVEVSVGAVWYAGKEVSASVEQGETTALDLQIDPLPLKIDDADRKLADEYNQSFDWTSDTLSIVVLAAPTRRAFESAVWFRNPAMFRDTSAESKVTPTPKPSIGGSGGDGLDFPVSDKQALDSSSFVDAIDKTPIAAAARGEWMIWERMVKVLSDWDPTRAAPLKNVGSAVRQQQWGGSSVHPQQLERAWIHQDEIWVSVVFESFVELGSGISDSDGDGRKEVFARVAADHYTKELVDRVRSEYLQGPRLSTLQLKEVTDDVINDLYDSTDPKVINTIGQPFDVPGKGRISYPFVVLEHASGQQNVLLVGP